MTLVWFSVNVIYKKNGSISLFCYVQYKPLFNTIWATMTLVVERILGTFLTQMQIVSKVIMMPDVYCYIAFIHFESLHAVHHENAFPRNVQDSY